MNNKTISGALAILVLSALVFFFSITFADPDLWGHVRYGMDMWESGQIIHVDSYSYLSDRPWINHEWLAEAIFAGLYLLAGSAGLVAFKVAVVLAIVGLVYWHLRQVAFSPAGVWLLTLLLFPALWPAMAMVRPQLFTLLMFAALLVVLYRADQHNVRWLWLSPPLIALWINFHGGVLAGLALIAFWTGLHLLRLFIRERRFSVLRTASAQVPILATVAAFAALFINPYGAGLPLFLLETATGTRPEISDWQPIVLRSLWGGFYLLVVALALVGLRYSRRQQSPALVAIVVLMLFAPLVAIRHLPLTALVVLFFMGEHIYSAWQRAYRPRPLTPVTNRWAPLSMSALVLVGAAGFTNQSLPAFSCIHVSDSFYPTQAVARIQESGLSGNMVVDFNWGQYALWHLAPEIKVSMDGRRETVYTDETYHKSLRFMGGRHRWDALLEEGDPLLVLTSKERPSFNLMNLRPDWVLAYEDEVAGLFVPVESDALERIQAVEPPVPNRCFG